ncbi:MAG: hypothetical protein QW803_12975 [Candidatus Methanomethylicia archaeon]
MDSPFHFPAKEKLILICSDKDLGRAAEKGEYVKTSPNLGRY